MAIRPVHDEGYGFEKVTKRRTLGPVMALIEPRRAGLGGTIGPGSIGSAPMSGDKGVAPSDGRRCKGNGGELEPVSEPRRSKPGLPPGPGLMGEPVGGVLRGPFEGA
jgi:hypothetical protein